MKKCRITVMRKAFYPDLAEKYENPIEHACGLNEGQVFICNGWQRPEGSVAKPIPAKKRKILLTDSGRETEARVEGPAWGGGELHVMAHSPSNSCL